MTEKTAPFHSCAELVKTYGENVFIPMLFEIPEREISSIMFLSLLINYCLVAETAF